jgi:hypothetical protein
MRLPEFHLRTPSSTARDAPQDDFQRQPTEKSQSQPSGKRVGDTPQGGHKGADRRIPVPPTGGKGPGMPQRAATRGAVGGKGRAGGGGESQCNGVRRGRPGGLGELPGGASLALGEGRGVMMWRPAEVQARGFYGPPAGASLPLSPRLPHPVPCAPPGEACRG